MTRHWRALPSFAETYVDQLKRRTGVRMIVQFHRWLRRNQKTVGEITGADLERFAGCPGDRPVGQMTRNDYRYEARKYLRWLEERGLAGPFGPHELDGYRARVLPPEMQAFLRFLAPIRKQSTIRTYRTILGRFHDWLTQRQIALMDIDRAVCLEWAQQIHRDGSAAATRVGMLVCVRKYVDWLFEAGLVTTPGHLMIRGPDLPKKPDYLPRPLPPEADQVLQARLSEDSSPRALGLLLMRRTGLRIGELQRLERECVVNDHAGGRFLKVPLGKLDSERLVPLDARTFEVLQHLQGLARTDQRWLIEGARARPTSKYSFGRTLAQLGGGLSLTEPLTSHRLRHTFASSLINGGMSLLGIMKLLGHRDQRMTLRYTAIADATVGREYFEALTRIAERYELPPADDQPGVLPDPLNLVQDVIRWLSKHLYDTAVDKKARLLARRLEAVRNELGELLAHAQAIESAEQG